MDQLMRYVVLTLIGYYGLYDTRSSLWLATGSKASMEERAASLNIQGD